MTTALPRLPLKGNIDLTYRCNNVCRHCWLWLPHDAPESAQELTFDELCRIVNEARAMGCRQWAISGGEPMLRPDFVEIFDYITRKCASYSLNTNGTLITPEIARLMTRRGNKMVALYGATAEVHDRVTRSPGSFEATMRGFAYLKEAGAGFTVQLIPMRENYHQYEDMVKLAQSLSPYYRVGAPWLYMTSCRSQARNREIARQRLDPATALTLDEPDAASLAEEAAAHPAQGDTRGDDRLFASCIAVRRDFHIDPYGHMSFCCFIKDPALRYDVRRGTFQQAWDEFIPALADCVHGGQEYLENCGSCDLRRDCRWCAVYGYLEHGRYSARVDYLCQVAQEMRRFKETWRQENLRYYRIGGVTIQVAADLPITEQTFDARFKHFRVDSPGEDMVSIRHHFSLPDPAIIRLGKEVYRRPPWAIYQQKGSWVYLGISAQENDPTLHRVVICDDAHTGVHIHNPNDEAFRKGRLPSLTMFPTDQILLARVLADRQACYLHSSGVILNGQGLLFVGHSEAGKSTMTRMLGEQAEILCDDRNIVRRWPEGFRVHGSWSHGEVAQVSSAEAPLRAIFLLEKADNNRLIPVADKKEVLHQILSHVIKPLVTADWWEKTLDVANQLAAEVSVYTLQFDMSGQVVDMLKQLVSELWLQPAANSNESAN